MHEKLLPFSLGHRLCVCVCVVAGGVCQQEFLIKYQNFKVIKFIKCQRRHENFRHGHQAGLMVLL